MHLGTRPLAGIFAALFFIACSSESGNAASGGNGSNGATSSASTSCSDVCAAVGQKCGSTPPDCDSRCGSFDERTRACITGASSCAAIDACGSASAGADGGTSSNEGENKDPCAKCGATQFCVSASPVASEIGCFDPPASCNGSTTSICPCLYSPGTGPCSNGAKTCSEGLANRVTCQ